MASRTKQGPGLSAVTTTPIFHIRSRIIGDVSMPSSFADPSTSQYSGLCGPIRPLMPVGVGVPLGGAGRPTWLLECQGEAGEQREFV